MRRWTIKPKTAIQATEFTEDTEMKRVPGSPMDEVNIYDNQLYFSVISVFSVAN